MMFRSILFKTIESNGYCTKSFNNRFRSEINSVKLTGTLISDATALETGIKSFIVRTNNHETADYYQIHNVVTRGIRSGLKAGKRISVFGQLSSFPFQTNGQQYERFVTRAHRIIFLENSKYTKCDQNCINFVADISAPIIEKESVTIIKVAKHFTRYYDQTKGIGHYTIFVYDEQLRKLAKNFKLKDSILISGALQQNTHIEGDGKKMYSNYIVLTAINKIKQTEFNVKENDVRYDEATN